MEGAVSKTRDANRVRTIFYPMAGSVEEQFSNLLQTLQWIDTSRYELALGAFQPFEAAIEKAMSLRQSFV